MTMIAHDHADEQIPKPGKSGAGCRARLRFGRIAGVGLIVASSISLKFDYIMAAAAVATSTG